VIDWESKDSHRAFINSPSYGPFKARLASLMESVHLHHIPQPDTKLIGRAPVTEVATFHDAEPGMLENVEKVATTLEKNKPEGFHGAIYGKVIEEIVRHKDAGKKDVEGGEAVVLLIGWDSKEAHLKFRETELFKENIWLLREKNGGSEMFHVPFKASTSVV
jgi:heme-degrading monooxygenase HmoA